MATNVLNEAPRPGLASRAGRVCVCAQISHTRALKGLKIFEGPCTENCMVSGSKSIVGMVFWTKYLRVWILGRSGYRSFYVHQM